MKIRVLTYLLMLTASSFNLFCMVQDETQTASTEMQQPQAPIVPDKKDQLIEENVKDDTYSGVAESGVIKTPVANAEDQERYRVNIDERKKLCIDLVKKAQAEFNQKNLTTVFTELAHNLRWRRGEVFVFVLDAAGNILVHGDDTDILWKNFSQFKAFTGVPIFDEIKETSKAGGWVNYPWHQGYKSSYVSQVKKDGEVYIVGAGFFPASHAYVAEQLVKLASKLVASPSTGGLPALVGFMNNPFGPFSVGDIFLTVYDLEGNVLGQSENAVYVNQNLLNYKDSAGNFPVREIIKVAKSRNESGWVNYIWKNEPLRAYVELVTEPTSKKKYAIAGGYYPNVNKDDAIAFVRRAIQHLKNEGAKTAFDDFNNPAGEYVRGGLGIAAMDFDGTELADGINPSFRGQNVKNRKDSEGKYINRELLKMAAKFTKGTLTTTYRNAYTEIYYEVVDVPDGKFIIFTRYFPVSKQQLVKSYVSKGVESVKNAGIVDSAKLFSDPESEFYLGDIYLFVYTLDGTCLVNGMQKNLIWKNFAEAKDEAGKNIVDSLIDLAKAGGGWASYKSRNAVRRVFVHPAEVTNTMNKKPITYVVGSGYFL